MMDNVIGASCIKQVRVNDFGSIAKRIQERVQRQRKTGETTPRPLANAVLFQESRCGSTLVANLWSQLPNSRVFVEPSAPGHAVLMCQYIEGPCFQNAHNNLVQDVFYVMASTVPDSYDTIFYKMFSASTRGIEQFGRALPDIPWYFLHRDPVEVMMSYFKSNDALRDRNTVCLRSYRWEEQPEPLLQVVKEQSNGAVSNPRNLSYENYCAAHLASLEFSVWREHNRTGKGHILDYSTLPSYVWEHMIEDVNIQLTDTTIEKMQNISGYYSKGRGKTKEYVPDTSKKHNEASAVVKKAAAHYLEHFYDSLEAIRQAA